MARRWESVKEREESREQGNNEMKKFFKRNRWTFTEKGGREEEEESPHPPQPCVHIKTLPVGNRLGQDE